MGSIYGLVGPINGLISLVYGLIFISLAIGKSESSARSSYLLHFQKDDTFDLTEYAEYRGEIPQMSSFTACHWELVTYFGIRISTTWSYCVKESAIVEMQ